MSTTPLKPTELLKPGHLLGAAEERGDYFAWVENDVPLSRVLTPGFWAHHASSIKAGARIEVMRRDGSLDVTLRAYRVEPGLVFVRPLFPAHEDNSAIGAAKASALLGDADVPTGYKVHHNPKPPTPGWFVQLNSTGEWIAKGLTSKELAIAKARQHAAMSAGEEAKVA